jgi:hypothetical protein
MRTVAIFSCGSNALKSAGGRQFPRCQEKKPHREQHGLMANRWWLLDISVRKVDGFALDCFIFRSVAFADEGLQKHFVYLHL